MKRFVFPVVLCASFVGSAQNVPQQLAVSARLSNAGAPLTGSHTVLTRLFDSLTGGSELWSESALANADNGLVTLMLGAQSPLSPAVLDGRPLFVEFIVDGQVLSPRLPVVSVPYAVRSSVSASAATLGNLAPGDVALASHTHTGTYLPVGAVLTCNGTDKVVGLAANGSVMCAADVSGTTYVAGQGLLLNGATFSANFAGNGVATTVARSDHHHDGAYLPLGGALTCSGTQKVTGLSSTGSVLCAADVDTSYGAGAGLSLMGTNLQVNFAGSGSATTAARSDHGHAYSCPGGFRQHWFSGGSPEGTKILCTRAVAGAVTAARGASAPASPSPRPRRRRRGRRRAPCR
jgi:hypothetical protein